MFRPRKDIPKIEIEIGINLRESEAKMNVTQDEFIDLQDDGILSYDFVEDSFYILDETRGEKYRVEIVA
jgi:hypothetical protein